MRQNGFVIPDNLKNATIGRTIRFTESLFEDLHQIAAQNGISFNKLVLLCCNYALEQMKIEELS